MQINPSFSGGISGVKPQIRPSRLPTQQGEEVAVPERAELNFIPSAESIATFVQHAISALKQGIYWDRGTILNVLV